MKYMIKHKTKHFKLLITLLLTISIVFGMVSCKDKEPIDDQNIVNNTIELNVKEFNKYGNVILETTFDELKNNNIEIADLITVEINNNTYDIPVGTEYSDVDSGSMICRFDQKDSKVILAVNGGNFAETVNMAKKEKIEEDPGYQWDIYINTVKITLKEKNGYHDEYVIRHLTMTYVREDYANLTDAEYANCRGFLTSKSSLLFRGTTPFDASYGRNTYTMAFLQENNIKSVINLTDSKETMEAYETYADSYYSTCNILNDVMDYQFASADFGEKVAIAIRFMLENDGPYYIHCKEGKDRTGIFCAILECYLGATYEEVKEDYMTTYANFYNIIKDSENYQIIVKTNLNKNLCNVLKVTDAATADLKQAAEAYYLSIGLTKEELTNLQTKLLNK